MALDRAAEWRDDGDVKDWMLQRLKSEAAPQSLMDCHQNEQWWELFCLWAVKNYMDESVDFLNQVDDYRRSSDGNKADEIYREFLSPDARRPVNASDGNVDQVREVYSQDPPLRSLDMFDAVYTEIENVLNGNYQQRFVRVAGTIREELQAADQDQEESDDEGPIEISAPTRVELTRAQISMATVDSFNQGALKELRQGQSAVFWQLDDLVMIDHPNLGISDQPYYKWLRQQDGAARGEVEMTEKGGALFNPGVLTVTGSPDQAAFKTAMGRISKKKIVFA